MLIASIQVLLLLAAAALLYRLWRRSTPAEPWLRLVVVLGFLARAVAGQALFWISWAEVPLARSMQAGNGLWFFAADAQMYLRNASEAASGGIWAIVTYDRTSAAVTYTQVLSAATLFFGNAASVAVLVNLFSYLGMVALLLHWRHREPQASKPIAFAIAGISLSPTFILWSLQPLKDSFFQFLVVAFVAACAAWQRAWVERASAKVQFLIAAAMLSCLYAISGVRWYFGMALLIATSLFLLLNVFTVRVRRGASALVAAALVFLLSTSLLLSARPYLPPTVLLILQPWTAVDRLVALPARVVGDIDGLREGFNRTGGATMIRAGKTLDRSAPPPAAKPSSPPTGTTPAAAPTPSVASVPTPSSQPPAAATASQAPGAVLPPSGAEPVARSTPPPSTMTRPIVPSPDGHPDVVQLRATLEAYVEAWNSGDMRRFEEFWLTRDTEFLTWVRQSPAKGPTGTARTVNAGIQIEDRQNALISGEWEWTSPQGRVLKVRSTMRAYRTDSGWRFTSGGAPTREDVTVERETEIVAKPTSRVMRLISGAAAAVIPRSIGERLGLFSIGGGRGLFWFVELDTLVFDVVLVLSIAGVAMMGWRAVRSPLTVMVVLLTVLVGVPLIYTVTNFGTLFRLREMIYLGLLLAPAAAASRVKAEGPLPS